MLKSQRFRAKNSSRRSTKDRVDSKPDSATRKDEAKAVDIVKKDRISWVESQIIGRDAVLETPFGFRKLTYADHTATGRCLQFVENYIIKHVLPFYGNTHTSDSYVGTRTTRMVNEAKSYIKRCLGGSEHDSLIFAGSGTTGAIKRLQEVIGINVPSNLRDKMLKCIPNEERWIVFVGPFEHHSNLLSWRQSLAEVVEIGLNQQGLMDMDDFRLKLEKSKLSGRPILGSFSACSNVTGIYTDTRQIATLLHQHGAFACFDFAASAPYVKIKMRSGEMNGYDAVYISPQKFPGGPGSSGILMMSNFLYRLKSSSPSTAGGGTVHYVNPFDEKDTLYAEDIEEREDAGTPPIIQKIRAALSFWVKEYIGYETMEQREDIHIQRALERLLPNPNIWVLGNTGARRQPIVSFLVYSTTISPSGQVDTKGKPLHGAFVAKLLNDLFGIQARGGCACAGPYGHRLLGIDETQSLALRVPIQMGYLGVKPGWTRISFPYYMSAGEFEFILKAVEFISNYGQRFLPLYRFNWKTGVWSFSKNAFKDIIQTKENELEFGQGSLANSLNGLNLNAKNEDDKYASYLNTAELIASLLPKFPAKEAVPEDINQIILHFRV